MWYFVFFVFLVLVGRARFSRKKKLIVLGVFLFVISAFRYGISFDYFIYSNFINFGFRHYEMIPALLETLAANTWPQLFFVITSAIILVCFLWEIYKNSKNPVDSIYFYIGFPFLFISHLSTVRQALATGLIFIFLLMKPQTRFDWIKKIFLLVLAVLCHASAGIALIGLLPIERLKKKYYVVAMVSSCIFGNVLLGFLFPYLRNLGYIGFKLNEYLTTEMAGHSLELILMYGLVFFLMMKHDSLVIRNPTNRYYLYLCYIGTILAGIFAANFHMSVRFFAFFSSPILLMISDVIAVYGIPKFVFRFFCIAAFSLSIWNGYVNTQKSVHKYHFYPYTFIFEVDKNEIMGNNNYQ